MIKLMNIAQLSGKLVFTILVGITAAIGLAAASNADNIHAHQEIMNKAKEFIEQDLNLNLKDASVTIKSLDSRLRLHQCSHDLNAFWPPGAQKIGHTSIGVRCEDQKPWKIFISAHIQQFTDIWVTTTAIARDTVITDNHVKLARRDISKSITQNIPSTQSPIGLVTKRPLRAGDALQFSALVKQNVVKRGDRVHVVGRKNGLEIRTSATALSDGAAGERIRVRSLSSKKELEGILQKDSTVYVNI